MKEGLVLNGHETKKNGINDNVATLNEKEFGLGVTPAADTMGNKERPIVIILCCVIGGGAATMELEEDIIL